jgi:hypothetical protein
MRLLRGAIAESAKYAPLQLQNLWNLRQFRNLEGGMRIDSQFSVSSLSSYFSQRRRSSSNKDELVFYSVLGTQNSALCLAVVSHTPPTVRSFPRAQTLAHWWAKSENEREK